MGRQSIYRPGKYGGPHYSLSNPSLALMHMRHMLSSLTQLLKRRNETDDRTLLSNIACECQKSACESTQLHSQPCNTIPRSLWSRFSALFWALNMDFDNVPPGTTLNRCASTRPTRLTRVWPVNDSCKRLAHHTLDAEDAPVLQAGKRFLYPSGARYLLGLCFTSCPILRNMSRNGPCNSASTTYSIVGQYHALPAKLNTLS